MARNPEVRQQLITLSATQQRAELHRTIWAIAESLRGSIDGWDFKAYVLGFLFYRYLSENLTNYVNSRERQVPDQEHFDYAKITDEQAAKIRSQLTEDRGFFIKPSQLFQNVVARCETDPNLNITLSEIFGYIESSSHRHASAKDFDGLFNDINLNTDRLGATVTERNHRIVKILHAIADMKLGDFKDNSIDAFGDTFEYLMKMYAANGGKSGGEFYTPQEVSYLLTKLALGDKTFINKVYDPTCGSGSLLLQSAKILGPENIESGFFGQDNNLTTVRLCKINMFLHDIPYDHFNIQYGDTLLDPKHWDYEPFDVIVSNPPFSTLWPGDSDPQLIEDPRFAPADVLAPRHKKADLAFVMHSLAWLSEKGAAAIVCWPGIFYRKGAEAKIRDYLVKNNFIDAVIEIPANLFFGTSVTTCILVLKKNKTDNNILFMDASECYVKAVNSNRLSDADIEKILKGYFDRVSVPHFVQLVPITDIPGPDYNLSPSTYVEAEDRREKINIEELNASVDALISEVNSLHHQIVEIVREIG